MAGWVGVRICRQYMSKRCLEVALIFIAVCVIVPKSFAQHEMGFLSIDCGNTRTNFTDSNQLEWVADDGTYIITGNSSEQVFLEPSIGKNQALRSYRFFPERRSKYCYKLPTPDPLEISYLIRVSFYLNESVLNERKPFEFILSIDGNDWFTLRSSDDSQTSLSVVQEGIFYPLNAVTYFCLRSVVGVPFISSLELRGLLKGNMYIYSVSSTQYLALVSRYNTGASSTAPDVRYPEDTFDRIWKTPDASWADTLPIISGTTSLGSLNFVPPKVLQDAWLFQSPNNRLDDRLASEVSFGVYENVPQVSMTPGLYIFVIVYALDLNTTASKVEYTIDVSLGPAGEIPPPATLVTDNPIFNSSQVSTMQVPFFYPTANDLKISLRLCAPTPVLGVCGDGDGRLPSMNAIEIYGQYNFNFSKTNPDDDEIITDLKAVFSLTDWQGDPCVPVPHDWLSCTVSLLQPNPIYYVTSINIRNREISGFSNRTTSATLSRLKRMSITNSGVDQSIFAFLMNYGSSLLSELNLSYNALTSLPAPWENTTGRLAVLDLSHTQLQGNISSLDKWVQRNSWFLQELYVSENNLSGIFSSSLYFSGLPNLTTAYFDQNSIEGTLDLSAWYAALQEAARVAQNRNTVGAPLPLFSFVDNLISDIIPSAETFGFEIQNLLMDNAPYGILLGGNPYCKQARSYFHRYLCRSTINDIISNNASKLEDSSKVSKKTIMIVGMCGGTIALLLCCVTFATSWRLWKQVYAIREVEKALANRKVQPPFYQYCDLKLATRDFHTGNKLGKGAFGVVYEGVLPDKTLIAVKKLFNSQRVQALDQFLNEVVLITGIKHRNLVQLKGCCIRDQQRMLIYEYVEKGNLAEALLGSKPYGVLAWKTRFNICIGVARGLSYLHEELQPCIIHRDIKPENILLDKDFKPKIGDFGLARYFSGETSQADGTRMSKVAGTKGYLAPEYALHGQLSSKADVYSFGILVLEVVSGRNCIDLSLPFEKQVLKDWVCSMQESDLLIEVLQPELRDNCVQVEVYRTINIALQCTQLDPKRRPSMSRVVAMFLGSMDVELFPDNVHLNSNGTNLFVKDLVTIINRDIEYFALRAVEEGCASSSLCHGDSRSSPKKPSFRPNSMIVELRGNGQT